MAEKDINYFIKYVENEINEITVVNTKFDKHSMSKEEAEKRANRMAKLTQALEICTYGDIKSKQIVKSYIEDILSKEINDKNIDEIKNWNKISNMDKFHVILYKYKQLYNIDAFDQLIKKYKLDELKRKDNRVFYAITKDEIDEIFEKEKFSLTYREKLDLIIQEIYSKYKGLGAIDELRDMYIDGISGGVSGVPSSFEGMAQFKDLPKAYESVWVLYKAINMRIESLTFESYEELERVAGLVCKYNSTKGDLSKKQGYILNAMADGSRVLSLRPEFAEEWMFFIRKFDIPDISIEELIPKSVKNRDILIKILNFLMKTCQVTAITGEQGAGKTTLLISMLEFIYDIYTLRFSEIAFEAKARRRYPYKNIASVQEIEGLNSQDAINILKKSDGNIAVITEVADDKTCAVMIESALVAWLSTFFTHHAMDEHSLVKALRDSLLKENIFRDESLAEDKVVQVLQWNIHLGKLPGKRFIKRITEYIPLSDQQRTETGKFYEANNIIIFNEDTETFEIKNLISDEKIMKMRQKLLLDEDKIEFDELIKTMKKLK